MSKQKKILLVVTGGVAAYKSIELVRLLVAENYFVTPVMTESATQFVTPLSLSVLSGQKVQKTLWDIDSEIRFGHIELSRQADLIVVAPATANFIAKTANGLADDLATNIILATNKPVLMAPAMNVRMWEHEATQRNIRQLKNDGINFLGPKKGSMACGEFGYGRMAEPIEIFEDVETRLNSARAAKLKGKRVLVTSGPTEEPIDPVRYISNRSSGLQGVAIAEALVRAGADVIFVTGPATHSMPCGVEVVPVQTASDMLKNVKMSGPFDVVICVAAVSDWQMMNIASGKLKKDPLLKTLQLELVRTPDILEQISKFNPRPKLIIGFAAETDQIENNALIKLQNKKCDWILANDVSIKNGVMGKEDTQITIFSKNGKNVFPRMSKIKFSNLLIDKIIMEFE